MGPHRRRHTAQDPTNHFFEIRLRSGERSGTGGAQLNFDGDQLARTFERTHDPAEAPERDGPIGVSRRILCAIDGPEELFEQAAHLLVRPRRRVRQSEVHGVRDGVVVPAKPDFDLERHGAV